MQASTGACLARAGHAVGAQADGHSGGAAGVGVAQRPQVRRGVRRCRVGAEAVDAQLLQVGWRMHVSASSVSGSLQGNHVPLGGLIAAF